MNQKLFLLFLFFGLPLFLFAQQERGVIDLNDEAQIHILRKKNGEKYVGRITAFGQKEIIFQPEGMPASSRFSIRRKDVTLIQSFSPQNNNNGQLRSAFQKVKDRYPDINLDSSLDINNVTQEVRVTHNEGTYEGRIFQLLRKGIQLQIANRTIFFKYKNVSKIEAVKLTAEEEQKAEEKQEIFFQTNESWTKWDTLLSDYVQFDKDFMVGETNQLHVVHTYRGDQLSGTVDSLNDQQVFLTLKNDQTKLVLDRTKVEKIEVHKEGYIRKTVQGTPRYRKIKTFVGEDYILGQNRLFVSPTGFGLKSKESEYRVIQGLIHNFDYGVTDNFSIGLGFYPLVISNLANARVNVSGSFNDYFHISGNAQILVNVGGIENKRGDYGWTAGGALSIGSPRFFLNFGYSRWRATEERFFTSGGVTEAFRQANVVSFGISFKIGSSFRCWADVMNHRDATEVEDTVNFYEDFTHITFGGSWFKRFHKIDFGLFIQPGIDTELMPNFIALPIVGYVRRF